MRHVGKHFGETCENPAVSTCPETFSLAACCLYFRVYILGITVIKLLVLVEHQAVTPQEIIREFVKVFHFSRELIHLGHDGHDHVESIGPPPEMCLLHGTFVAHDFDGASYFIRGGYEVIHVNVCLEADLPIAKENKVLSLAISLVLPVGTVITFRTLPFVVAAPFVRVGVPICAACEAVGFHVASVVGGMIPKRADVGRVVGLPVVVDTDNHV